MRALICLRMKVDNTCGLGGNCTGFDHCGFWLKAEVDNKWNIVSTEEEILNR